MLKKLYVIIATLVTGSALFSQTANLLVGDTDVEVDSSAMTNGPWSNSTGEITKWRIERTSGFQSKSSIKLLEFCGIGINSVKLPAGKYTFSFWAKGAKDGARAYITVNKVDSSWPEALKNRADSPITLTTDWKRYSFTFTSDGTSLYSPYYGIEKESAYFDRFMLNSGDAPLDWVSTTKYMANIELPPANGNVFPFEQAVNIKVNLFNYAGTAKPEGTFDVKVIDYLGETVAESKKVPEFDSTGKYSISLTISGGKSGWYGITASMKGLPNYTAALVMTRPPEPLVKGIEPFVGLCGAQNYVEAAKLIGVGWLEKYLLWSGMEPSPGVYKYDFDKFREYRKQGFKIKLLVHTCAPEWMQDKETLKQAAAFNISYSRLLPPANKLDVEWRKFIANFLKENKDIIDVYELGPELDALIGLNTYYKSLDTKNTVNSFVLGESLERVAKQMNIAAEEILKAVPDAKISGVRPSDVDSRYAYAYSKEFFKLCGKNINIFGLDCYPQPRWIGPGQPATGSERELETRYKDALAVMKAYGNGTDIFISEYGYFIDYNEVYNPKYTLEQVNRLARSYLKARTLGMKSLWWFTTESASLEGKHYNMGIWWNNMPLPAVAALNAVGRIVNNVTECTELPSDNENITVSVYRKSDGRAVSAIWSVNPAFSPIVKFVDDKFTVTDVMGNPIKATVENGTMQLRISEQPFYIWRTENGSDNYALMKKSLEKLKIQEDLPVEVFFRCGSKSALKVYMKSTSRKNNNSGVIEYSYAKGTGTSERFTIPAGGTIFTTIPLPEPGQKIKMNIKFEGEYPPFNAEFTTPELIKIAKIDGLKINGPFEDWQKITPVTISGRDHIMPVDHTTYDGPEDLSAKLYLAHDGKYLYFAADVTDDKHFNKFSETNIWKGDCIQIGFDPKTNFIRNVNDMDQDDIFMTSGLLSKGQSLVVHRAADKSAITGKTEYGVVRNEKTKQTLYTLKIPLSLLDPDMKSGTVFGFNCVVMDDDTDSGADYWLYLKQGLAGGLRPDKFAQCVLE